MNSKVKPTTQSGKGRGGGRRQSGASVKGSKPLKPVNGRPSVGGKTPGVKTPAARVGGTPTRGRGSASETTTTTTTTTAAGRGKKRARVDDMEMSDRENDDNIRVRAIRAMVEEEEEDEEETGTAPTGGRVLFEDCCDVPSPTPIGEMSPGALESVITKSPSSMQLGGSFDAATPQSPMAAAFAMISEFLESPTRERPRSVGDFWGLPTSSVAH